MAIKFPNIFLDTNTLRSGNGKNIFENKYIKWLEVYKNLTKAKIYTSEAFELELYYQESNRIESISSWLSKISERYPSYTFPTLDKEEIIWEYQKQIKRFFSNIVPATAVDIKECLRRAIEKIAPCSENKEEFRDTVWWLSYLSILKKWEECIFISNDNHFDWCKNDHKLVKRYKTLHDFFKDFDQDFLDIKIWERDFLDVFPISEIKEYLWYPKLDEDGIQDYIDSNWTDFVVSKNNDLQHLSTDIVCTNYEWNKYTFSFTVSFLCWFEIHDERWEDMTDTLLWEWWIFEDLNWDFTYENWEITINYDSINNYIEKESLSSTLKEMEADFYQDIWMWK